MNPIQYKTIDFCWKIKGHKQKAFQTNNMKIRYNCAKRYHALFINCAKGIILGLVSVLNIIIFFTYMPFSFFNNSINQGKWGLSLGIMEGKSMSSLMQYVHF